MTDGVIVTATDKNGLAAHYGIKAGDIITSIDHQPVTSPRQFREVVKSVDVKKGALVTLISDGSSRFEILKEGKDN